MGKALILRRKIQKRGISTACSNPGGHSYDPDSCTCKYCHSTIHVLATSGGNKCEHCKKTIKL